MDTTSIKTTESFKIKKENLVYSILIFVFFIIPAIAFYISASFISTNLNKVYEIGEGDKIQKLNMDNYLITVKKLKISTSVSSSIQQIPAPTNRIEQNIGTLSIEVLNGTTKKGIAGDLAKKIADAGFTVSKTGNEISDTPITTLLFQEGKTGSMIQLLKIVQNYYPKAIATTTKTVSAYDVVITIGND